MLRSDGVVLPAAPPGFDPEAARLRVPASMASAPAIGELDLTSLPQIGCREGLRNGMKLFFSPRRIASGDPHGEESPFEAQADDGAFALHHLPAALLVALAR